MITLLNLFVFLAVSGYASLFVYQSCIYPHICLLSLGKKSSLNQI